jgi:hypothetical protein
MGGPGPDGFLRWLLAAIAGAGDMSIISADAAGTVQAEVAKLAGTSRVEVQRARRNGGRVDVMLADETGTRWAVVAGLDGEDKVASLWMQREPVPFSGTAGGLVIVLNGPSSSGKSSLATAVQQAADTPWIRLLPDEFAQWHLPEQYWAFGRAAGPWQDGFFGALAALARAGNQVITCAAGMDSQAGWRRRLAGSSAREWHTVHQGWAHDVEIDTGTANPQLAAGLVLASLASGKAGLRG